MKSCRCPVCHQVVNFYTNDSPETIDCPRCGLTRLIVEKKEKKG